MYFLFFKPEFGFRHFLRYPFKWIIRLFSQSKFNHVAHNIIKDGKMFISEAKSPYHRHIKLKDCIKEAKSKIYAYKIIKPIDYDKALQFEKEKFMIQKVLFTQKLTNGDCLVNYLKEKRAIRNNFVVKQK